MFLPTRPSSYFLRYAATSAGLVPQLPVTTVVTSVKR
jgi:hypothetical protein